jgi:hypothetical protein
MHIIKRIRDLSFFFVMFCVALRHPFENLMLTQLIIMKRLVSIAIVALFTLSLSAQSTIDKLFSKYQGQDGFTTVTINGNMLRLLADLGDEDEDDEIMQFANKFTSIRILAQEEEGMDVENFYDMVIDEVTKGGYEEMVAINSSGEDVKILVKTDGKVFKEFLLIAGGDDNAIIQIKGNLNYDEVKKMSESIHEDGGISGVSGLKMF